MPAHSSRTSDDPNGKLKFQEKVWLFIIPFQGFFFAESPLLIPKESELMNCLPIRSIFDHTLSCSYAPGYSISRRMKFENCPHQMRKQMGRGLARTPRKVPRMLKHHWTQPTRRLHFGFSALSQLPWQTAEPKRSSEIRPLILKATHGKSWYFWSEVRNPCPHFIRRPPKCCMYNPF